MKLSPAARRILITVVVIVLIGGGVLFAQSRIAVAKAGEWATARHTDLVLGIDISGELVSTTSQKFGPPPMPNVWNFKIAMMAPEGSEVQQGQPLVGFDTTELKDQLDMFQARVDTAQAEIDKARADLILRKEDNELQLAQAESALRKAELKLEAPDEIMSVSERQRIEVDYDIARKEVRYLTERNGAMERAALSQIRALESQRNRAQQRVDEITSNMERMMVRAPRAGTVVYLADRRNEKKKVGDQVWRMEKIIELPDLETMHGEGEVDEADSGKIAVGQKVVFRLDAHPDVEYTGRVDHVGNAIRESETNPSKMLDASIALEKVDTERMRPGMRFRGLVELDRIPGALLVPSAAVLIGEVGPYVRRQTVLGIEETPVELGRSNKELVQITSGLSAGDQVLISEETEEE